MTDTEILEFLAKNGMIGNVYDDDLPGRFTGRDTGCGCCSIPVEIPEAMFHRLEELGL